MQSKILTKTLSVILALAMVVGLWSGSFATKANAAANNGGKKNVSYTKVENLGNGRLFADKQKVKEFEEAYVKDGMVRVSIVLSEKSALQNGYSTNGLAGNADAAAYRAELRAQQNALADRISKTVLGGEKLDVVWNITLAGNMISANVPYDKLEAISMVRGVEKVVVETLYEPMKGETVTLQPLMSGASTMVGSSYVWEEGYTGLGGRIAIVDTGLDTNHELFDPEALEFAIEESGKNVELLTAAEIAEVLEYLNIYYKIGDPDLTAEDLYVNTKVPFGANYVDSDLDITHDNDGQGDHGSHVSGIAAGNRFVTDDEGGFVKSLDKVQTQGEAPDAQLLVMKVFGKGGGAYDSDYLVAIEDAFVLGCDSVNLSLGSAMAGMATSPTYQAIIDSFAYSDTVVSISAGNAYQWANMYGSDLYSDDVNYSSLGSPGSFGNALTVASVDNGGYVYLDLGIGIPFFVTETSGYGNEPIATIAGDHEYVYLDSVGTDEEWAALAEYVDGKIAVCNRGTTSFFEKVNAAADAGAIAVIIVNNQAGVINMNLTGIKTNIPAVSVTQETGMYLKYLSDDRPEVDHLDVYVGAISVMESGEGEYLMSDFSSWGVPGDLSLKPEITAPGGSIYSVEGLSADGKHYQTMSGTSMAAPQIAGLSALLGQYIRENGLEEKSGLTRRQLITSLLMSTAVPQMEPGYYYYSIMKQGAGLADVYAAINAKSFITVDAVAEAAPASAATSIADGKVKVELGVVEGDEFDALFSIHNYSDEDIAYYLSADFFTQYTDEEYRYKDTDPLYLATVWTIDGEPYEGLDAHNYDFNGDGVANVLDAQWILRCLVDEDAELFNEEYADFDGDEDIDTYDARLAFEAMKDAALVIPAGETVQVALNVSGLEEEFDGYEKGNYIEGFIFVTEGDTEDGALGVQHSIPVFGYYGDWSAPSMYDTASYLEFYYDEDAKIPYMAYAIGEACLDNKIFTVIYPNADGAYMLGGNPIVYDEEYHPERNAMSSDSVIKSAQYGQIRNAAAGRFYVTNKYGKVLTQQTYGPSYAAYYHYNQSKYMQSSTSTTVNFMPALYKEGTELILNYQLIPEYYVDANGGALWDEVDKDGTTFSLPVVIDDTAPFIVGAEYDDDYGYLFVSAHDNQYIAAVALFTEDGDLVNYYGAVEDESVRPGEQIDYPFDLSEFPEENHYLVEVYDYAAHVSTYKINLTPEEFEDPDVYVEINPDEGLIINNGTLQLSADVYPWGFPEDLVYWSSSDESIAVVDDNGLVTSVYKGDEDVDVIITATSAYDETKSAECVVHIMVVDTVLNGFIWDEEGDIWFSEFNVSKLPEYKKLTDAPLNAEIASAAYASNGKLYAYTFDTTNADGYVYTFDTASGELAEVGYAPLSYTDLATSSSLGRNYLVGTLENYLVIVNPVNCSYAGFFDVADEIQGSYLVGVAYMQTARTAYGMADYFFLVDDMGYLYYTAILRYQGSYAYFGINTLAEDEDDYIKLGDDVDVDYFQSLYFDGESLYWSRFNYTDNVVELIMFYDLFGEYSFIASQGEFATGVWPVAGLFEDRNRDASGGNVFVPSTELEIRGYASEDKIERSGDKIEEFKAAAGRIGRADGTHSVTTEVTVNVNADELTKNGFVSVEIPDTAELISVESNAQYWEYCLNEEEYEIEGGDNNGQTAELSETILNFAFVDLEGIPAGQPMLTLKFANGSTGVVTIYTYDINDDDAQYLIETVILGVVEAYHEIHTYAAEWDWYQVDNGDYAATATLNCTLNDGAPEYVIDADITKEFTDTTVKFIATVELEDTGDVFTDELEVPIAKIVGRTINLGERLSISLIYGVADEFLEDEEAFAVITFGEETDEVLLSECRDGKYFWFTKEIKPTQMRDALSVEIFTGDGLPVYTFDKDGNNITGEPYEFTMQMYLDLAKDTDYENLPELAEALEQYGNAAQIYYDYNADNLTVSDAVTAVTADDVADYAPVIPEELTVNLTGTQVALVLDSTVTLRARFNFAQGTDFSNYVFKIDGEAVDFIKLSKTSCYLELTDIWLTRLDEVHTFSVSDGNDEYVVEYSVLSYVYKALTSDAATVDLQNMMSALYLVSEAAAAYYGE